MENKRDNRLGRFAEEYAPPARLLQAARLLRQLDEFVRTEMDLGRASCPECRIASALADMIAGGFEQVTPGGDLEAYAAERLDAERAAATKLPAFTPPDWTVLRERISRRLHEEARQTEP